MTPEYDMDVAKIDTSWTQILYIKNKISNTIWYDTRFEMFMHHSIYDTHANTHVHTQTPTSIFDAP